MTSTTLQNSFFFSLYLITCDINVMSIAYINVMSRPLCQAYQGNDKLFILKNKGIKCLDLEIRGQNHIFEITGEPKL